MGGNKNKNLLGILLISSVGVALLSMRFGAVTIDVT